VQVFVSWFRRYEMRFHFSHITEDDWYLPYKGARLEWNRRGDMHELIVGYKSLHFDWWGSREGWPTNSVGVYYPVRTEWTRKGDISYEHKSLRLPDLIGILRMKRFLKRTSKSGNGALEGLGALFG